MKNIILILFLIIFAKTGFSATCTSISRTNNAANSVLTSTKYNLDINTVYTAANAFDGGCITDATLEIGALNTTDYQAVLSAPKIGCEVVWNSVSQLTVNKCRIAIDNALTVTATGTNIAYGCSGCSVEAASQTIYIYATTASTASTLDLLLSTTVPGDDGYSGTSRVLAKAFNDGGQNLIKIVPNHIGTRFEPSTVHIVDKKASGVVGGTFTGGSWRTRELNFLSGDTSIVSSLTSNRFSLVAGTYLISACAPAHDVDGHQIKLNQVTDNLDLALGHSAKATEAQNDISNSCFSETITINATKSFEIQHYGVTTKASAGFGDAAGTGAGEVYTQVSVTKLR